MNRVYGNNKGAQFCQCIRVSVQMFKCVKVEVLRLLLEPSSVELSRLSSSCASYNKGSGMWCVTCPLTFPWARVKEFNEYKSGAWYEIV